MVETKKSFDEWLNEEDQWPTPEEVARSAAQRKAMEGKWLETVTMKEDRTLMIVSAQYYVGGGLAEGCTQSAPGDSDYDELLLHHGPLTPGQSHTLVRKMVDGKWVILSDETGETKMD